MNEILSDLPGVVSQIDDVLVYGSTEAEHDKHLQAVLEQIQSAGVTLNKEKCTSFWAISSPLKVSLLIHTRQQLLRI